MEQTYIVAEPKDFKPVIKECLDWAKEQGVETLVLALQGDLGAGKTTFVQELAKTLKVTDIVTSPTFTIMKQYQIEHGLFSTLTHVDAYRFEDESESEPLHLEETFTQQNNLSCVEWPERIQGIMPQKYLQLEIVITKDNARTVDISVKTKK